ncbi:MAG TPA: hypothetical protein VFI37_12375 [Gaiellaceae bacterium]|nr:hypothetical protein [Gaiellaceae bacterium]
MRLLQGADGDVRVEADSYALELSADGLHAWLRSAAGKRLLCLRPAAALDTVGKADETLSVAVPRVLEDGDRIVVEVARRSTVWSRAATTIVCDERSLELRTRVEGRGSLTDARLLGFRALFPGGPTGLQATISNMRTLFTPSPGDAARILRPAGESAGLGVAGDGALGRGHTFFTPAPLYLALTDDDESWTSLGVVAPVEQLTFPSLVYEAGDRLFSLRLDYEGHTDVDGVFEAPPILLTVGVPDPYTGLRRHRDDLAARGAAPPVRDRDAPAWWSEPIFCGWGAQVHAAKDAAAPWGSAATQAHYDAFLDALEENGVVPGTIVIDDKWQSSYGANAPDRAKWPDLAGWIAARHARGQKVLLWLRAWAPEGLPPALCVRTPAGEPVGLDPSNQATREVLTAMVARLLGPDGLDADGLKIDFTGRTPAGRALVAHGGAWGIALLHELLRVVYEAAKAAKPDALVITQAPHPAFADVADMLRLNDMLRIDDPGPPQIVEQMRYRAAVAAAACPELLIDTDDWQAPSLAEWRAYLREKAGLGVPALYYATHLDATGEPLEPEDYAMLREVWDGWRAGRKQALEVGG